MRRAILNILRCPRCQKGRPRPDTDTPELVFGPLRCEDCHTTYPVSEGIADLLVERSEQTPLQRALEQAVVARSFERYVRPLLQMSLQRRRLDRQSEALLYESLLGTVEGPLLDLCCGTALFSRRFARMQRAPDIVAMDVSRPMLDEAMAQAREAGATLNLVRAEAPHLPFADGSLGGIFQASSLHHIRDLGRLGEEVARTLRPGARYVASTYLPASSGVAAAVQRTAGFFPRGEDELKSAFTSAGLARFERIALPPLLVVKVEKPQAPDT